MSYGDDLREQAAQLRAVAASLEAQADALDRNGQQSASEALGLAQLREGYGFSRESLKSAQARGLPVHRGPRGRLMVYRADVDSWIRSRAWSPASRKVERSEDDALDAALAELSSLDGCLTRSGQGFSAGSDESDGKSVPAPAKNHALTLVGGSR